MPQLKRSQPITKGSDRSLPAIGSTLSRPEFPAAQTVEG